MLDAKGIRWYDWVTIKNSPDRAERSGMTTIEQWRKDYFQICNLIGKMICSQGVDEDNPAILSLKAAARYIAETKLNITEEVE